MQATFGCALQMVKFINMTHEMIVSLATKFLQKKKYRHQFIW